MNFFISHNYDVTVDLSNDEISNKKKQLSVVCRRDSRDDGDKVAILCPVDQWLPSNAQKATFVVLLPSYRLAF